MKLLDYFDELDNSSRLFVLGFFGYIFSFCTIQSVIMLSIFEIANVKPSIFLLVMLFLYVFIPFCVFVIIKIRNIKVILEDKE